MKNYSNHYTKFLELMYPLFLGAAVSINLSNCFFNNKARHEIPDNYILYFINLLCIAILVGFDYKNNYVKYIIEFLEKNIPKSIKKLYKISKNTVYFVSIIRVFCLGMIVLFLNYPLKNNRNDFCFIQSIFLTETGWFFLWLVLYLFIIINWLIDKRTRDVPSIIYSFIIRFPFIILSFLMMEKLIIKEYQISPNWFFVLILLYISLMFYLEGKVEKFKSLIKIMKNKINNLIFKKKNHIY